MPRQDMQIRIEWGSFTRTPVDIIIPFHGRYELVSKLVRSILTATRSNPYKITLVDDGSSNAGFSQSFSEFEKIGQLQVVRNETRMGYARAIQKAFEVTKQPYTLFMHSDCEVMNSSWMIELGRGLLKLKDKSVRMVCPKTDNPGVDHPDLKGEFGVPGGDVVLDAAMPLYCFMCHRELFSRMGGFIKSYPCGYEDEELAFRMKAYGFRQAVIGSSFVKHLGSKTLEEVYRRNTDKWSKDMETSRALCLADMKLLKASK